MIVCWHAESNMNAIQETWGLKGRRNKDLRGGPVALPEPEDLLEA